MDSKAVAKADAQGARLGGVEVTVGNGRSFAGQLRVIPVFDVIHLAVEQVVEIQCQLR